MAITLDTQRRPLGAVGFDHMPSFPVSRPFNDPWIATSPSSSSNAAASAAHSSLFSLDLDAFVKQSGQRNTSGAASIPYSTVSVSAPTVACTSAAMPSSYGSSELLNMPNPLMGAAPRLGNDSTYPADLAYSAGPSLRASAHVQETSVPPPPPPPPPPPYDVFSSGRSIYAPQQQPQPQSQPQQQPQSSSTTNSLPSIPVADDRRWSQPAASPPPPPVPSAFLAAQVDSHRPRQASVVDLSRSMARPSSPPPTSAATSDPFVDVVHGGRSLLMLHDDNTTPRNIYDVHARETAGSYGFPHTHSSSSSVSSVASYPSYYGSMDSSASGYSSTAESVGSGTSRGAPRHHGSSSASVSSMSSSVPPAPQSMMGQFNSKVSTSAQKKHRCKICEKRFTRPSSLRTHTYSHTGEKPFSCNFDGCGRHFSVVSNLRRHRKVHRGDRDVSSPDEC